MTYKRDNLTFTQMCIYIDDNIYKEDCDYNRCYQYMYHVVYILAVRQRFFNSAKDYDEFALYTATRLFLRYTKKSLKHIKSVLNYVKKILYPSKVTYQSQAFTQVFKQDEEITKNLEESFRTSAISQNDNLMRVEFRYYLEKISTTIKEFLTEIPYYSDPVMWRNIYISCLLSVSSALTLNSYNRNRLSKREKSRLPSDDFIENVYKEEKKSSTVLYNLDKSMYNYINTIVNRIFDRIRRELRELIGSYEPSDAIIQSILMNPDTNTQEDYS